MMYYKRVLFEFLVFDLRMFEFLIFSSKDVCLFCVLVF